MHFTLLRGLHAVVLLLLLERLFVADSATEASTTPLLFHLGHGMHFRFSTVLTICCMVYLKLRSGNVELLTSRQ